MSRPEARPAEDAAHAPGAGGRPPRASVEYVRTGAFSGIALSLRAALARRVDVVDYDLLPLARHPALIPARLGAMGEALRTGRGVPWTKTAIWSRATERAARRWGLMGGGRPALFVQTLPAFAPNGDRLRYGVFTDRVALEGAAVGGPHGSRFSPGWLARERVLLRGAHRVYVMGPSSVEVLVERYGVPAERVRVVGGGPNMALGPPVSSTALRTLLFVGTQWDLKGGPEILEGFARARERLPELELLLVGSAPPGPLPPGVSALGRIPHPSMDPVYSRADAFVTASHIEAFGVALVEALMKGLPCIASSVGNQPWIVGEAGVLVEAGDVAGVAAAIERLALDYPRYRRAALERREELRRTASWEAVADVIANDLVPGGGGSS